VNGEVMMIDLWRDGRSIVAFDGSHVLPGSLILM
jgi:hypothetical protein